MKRLIVLVIAVTIIATGCRQTPESNVVNQRSYKALLETALLTATYDYPDIHTDSFFSKDGKVELVFDAKIRTPEVSKFPVIQIDPQPISNELMQQMVDEFLKGETGYYPESYLTKSEIEERLLNYHARLKNDALIKEEFDKMLPDADIDYDKVKEAIKRNIARYTDMLENAPEERANVPSRLNLRPRDFYTANDHNYRETELAMTQEQLDERAKNPQEHLYLVSDKELSNGNTMRFIVYNELAHDIYNLHDRGLHSKEHYEVQLIRARNDYFKEIGPPLCSANPINTSVEGVENFDAPYPDLTISEEEAVQLAQSVLDSLGIDNFYHANTRIRKEYPPVIDGQWDMGREDRDDKFYILTFKPMYYGIPLIHANNRYSQERLTSLPFAFEEIKMKVSNDVIVEFRWSNPTDVLNVINDNAKLLEFDEIIKIAKNHMKIKYNLPTVAPVWVESPTYKEDLAQYTGAKIKITEVRLGLGGVPAYNHPGEYMLIPVWSFYGTYALNARDEEKSHTYSDAFLPFVSVNAVDGSIIEQIAWVDYD